MIITERREADFEVDKIKNLVKESSIDYFIEESPFSLRLNIRKKYLRDFSSVSRNCALPSTQPSTEFYQPSKIELENTTQENDLLKVDISEKDTLILQLRSDLSKVENQNELVKKEISTKNEQLKQKNKKIEAMQKNLDKVTEEKDSSKSTFLNKIIKLEKHNANLREDLEKSKLEAKNKDKTENKELRTLKKDFEKKKTIIQNLKLELENVKGELQQQVDPDCEKLRHKSTIETKESQTPFSLLQPIPVKCSSPTAKPSPTTATTQPKTSIPKQPEAPNSPPTPPLQPTLKTVELGELITLMQSAFKKKD